MGILSAEYGLFTSSTPTVATDANKHGFDLQLILKNLAFFVCYFILLFVCVQTALKAMVDFIVSFC